jgi:hypothetical protein
LDARSLSRGDFRVTAESAQEGPFMKLKVATTAMTLVLAASTAHAEDAKVPSNWWENTSISGRMYYDVTSISNTTNGVKGPGGGNGTNFDIKRFYVGIDHIFNDMLSANVTTDTTYDSGTANGQIYLKKAYLQAKIDPLLTIRAGAADTPWIPYVEGIYGMRYLELTLVDRTKFGTSSDWGVHVLGSAFDGILNYDFAALNGGTYKKIPIGAGTNRAANFDYEGRISAAYQGFHHGVSGFGSYYFLPQWAAFARYDSVATNTRTAPGKNNEYYTLGLTWSPIRIVDFSVAYKHDAVRGGSFTDANGAIGSATGAMRGTYNEFGVWGDLQW